MSVKIPNILIFTLDYLPSFGGVAMYLNGIAGALPKGTTAVLAEEALLKGKERPVANHKIFYKKLTSKSSIPKWLPAFGSLSKTLDEFDADIILCSNILPLGLVTYVISRLKGKQYYVSLHGLDLLMSQQSVRKRIISKFVLNHAEAIIVNSNYTRSLVREVLEDEHQVVVNIYPCPVPIENQLEKGVARKELGYNADQKIILSVGRLVRRKGFDKIINLMPELLKKEPELKYVIVGNGPEHARLTELVKRNQLEQFVEIHTNTSNDTLAKFFSAANLFATPNSKIGADVEGFGLVFLEASLYGLPAIAGNSGGAPEAVSNGKTGIVVDPDSSEELKEAILKLIGDPALSQSMGEAGRIRTQEHFIWHHEVNKIVFCFNNI